MGWSTKTVKWYVHDFAPNTYGLIGRIHPCHLLHGDTPVWLMAPVHDGLVYQQHDKIDGGWDGTKIYTTRTYHPRHGAATIWLKAPAQDPVLHQHGVKRPFRQLILSNNLLPNT